MLPTKIPNHTPQRTSQQKTPSKCASKVTVTELNMLNAQCQEAKTTFLSIWVFPKIGVPPNHPF